MLEHYNSFNDALVQFQLLFGGKHSDITNNDNVYSDTDSNLNEDKFQVPGKILGSIFIAEQ